jgi:hypothetical protein
VVAFGGAESPRGDGLYGSPPGAYFCMCASSRALLHVGSLSLGVTLQRSAAPPFPSGPCVPPGAPYQNTLGAVPQDPLTLKLRLDTNDVNIVRTAPQIRSQGACGAFYFEFYRDRIKNQPYKRRRVGCNLRLSRADPALCSRQPSPLRCILLSPQGLTTLRGPRLYGVYRRVGGLGVLPECVLPTYAQTKVGPRRVGVQAVTLR